MYKLIWPIFRGKDIDRNLHFDSWHCCCNCRIVFKKSWERKEITFRSKKVILWILNKDEMFINNCEALPLWIFWRGIFLSKRKRTRLKGIKIGRQHEFLSDIKRSCTSREKVCQYQPWGPNNEKESEAFVKQVILDAHKEPRSRFVFAIIAKRNGVMFN